MPALKSSQITTPHPLGELIEHYPIHDQFIKRWLRLLTGLLMSLGAITLIVRLSINTWDRINIHGRGIILTILPRPAAFYVLLLFAGTLLITIAMIYWQDGIDLYERGLEHRSARKVTSWVYKDTKRFDSYISQITFGGSIVNIRVKVVLEGLAGKPLVIRNQYDRMMGLIEALREKILPDLIKENRQQLFMGDTLFFHRSLQAHQNNLIIKSKSIPYERVSVTFDNQLIKLHEKDNPKNVFLASKIQLIQNLDLLLNLLENPPKGKDQSTPK